MGKLVNLIYGGILIFLALDAMIFNLIPGTFLSILVVIMGVLILFTPLASRRASGLYRNVPAPKYQWLRRWVFGAYLVLSGIMSVVGLYSDFPFMANTSIYTIGGQLILIGIGLIYFLTSFKKTRGIQVHGI